MTRIHEVIETGPLQVNCQLLGSKERGEAILIDPGGDADLLLERLDALQVRLTHIINTHGHFDHVGGVAALKEATGALFWMHGGDIPLLAMAASQAASWGIPFGKTPTVDRMLQDNEVLDVAGLRLTVLHTPGHSQGGICLRWDAGVAVGDTLFAGSVGRTDLPGGNTRQLISSIRGRLLVLDGNLICYPGHGPATTIDREMRNNPYIQ